MISKDPYKILGVSPTASDAEIKSAYKELVKKYHPDQYQDNPLADVAEEKMSEINAAYDQIMTSRRGGGYQSAESGYDGYASSQGFDSGYIRRLIQSGSYTQADQIMCPPRKEMPSGISLKALSATAEAGSMRLITTSQEPSSSTLITWSIKAC